MYLAGLFYNQIDDEKLARAKAKMADILDRSVSAAEAEDQSKYVIHEGKFIDLSKLDVDDIINKGFYVKILLKREYALRPRCW